MSNINICIFCNKNYNNKYTLERHLITSCKLMTFSNNLELYNFIQTKKNFFKDVNNYKECTINNVTNNTVNINIELQPITNLNKMLNNEITVYNLIERYDDIKQNKNEEDFKNIKDVKYLLSDYLKTNLCNESKQENHCIKYITKDPPSYHIVEKKDIDGNLIIVIRGLKDSVDLLSDPVLNALKNTLITFEKTLKKDTIEAIKNGTESELKYDYKLYDVTIKALKNELNKKNVQAALKQFLKHEILNDINMKMTMI